MSAGATVEATENEDTPKAPSKTRLYVGILILILALAMPIWGSAIVAMLGLPPGLSAVLVGLSVAGGPDLLLLIAAAVMGKETLNAILGRISGWFKHNFRLAENVSKRRYIIGLILFWGSIVARWGVSFLKVQPSAPNGDMDWGLIILLSFELLLIVSIFVLGARYWDKLASLFRYNTRVVEINRD